MAAPTVEERRRERRSQARRAILDATGALLVEEGYAGFSIRKLVERCGYSAPTIYHHFGDKHGLIDALLEERFQVLYRQMSRVPRHADPLDHLHASARAFVRFGLRHPAHYQLLTMLRDPDRESPPSLEESREVLFRPLRELSDTGRLRSSDVDTAAQSIWSLAHGLISLQTTHPEYDWSDSLIEHSIEALLRGMVAPHSAPRTRSRQKGRT